MNKRYILYATAAACLLLAALEFSIAGDMKAALEVPADVRLFDVYFGRYGNPATAITTELRSVRFSLSSAFQKPEQLGLYSNFKVAGDFEISAQYEWTPVNVPKGGYGVRCGIKVETNDQNKAVALSRGNLPGKGSVYIVTEAKKVDGKIEYPELEFPTNAKKGRMILRREKNVVTCLAVDGAGEPKELCRVEPFTEASVHRVLIVADPGAAPTDMDARISDFKIRAEEITHKIPQRDLRSNWGWWLAGAALIGVAVGGYFVFRRYRHGRWGWSRNDD